MIRSEEEVWSRLLPTWSTFVANRRIFGQDISDLPYAATTDGLHIKVYMHYRSMPTAKSLDGASNNRSAKSWFAHTRLLRAREKENFELCVLTSLRCPFRFSNRPTFADINSVLRACVHRLTAGGVTFRTGDDTSHRCASSVCFRFVSFAILNDSHIRFKVVF